MSPPVLLAVPNVSEGRDQSAISALARAFAGGTPTSRPAGGGGRGEISDRVRLLDVHSDPDHHRSVYTLIGGQARLADALIDGAREALERLDLPARRAEEVGQHPHVGAVDVVPIVYLTPSERGAACAEALLVADRIGAELEVPVFLYGELTATGPGGARSRAELRRGGLAAIARRMALPGSAPGLGGPRDGGESQSPDGRSQSSGGRLTPDFGPAEPHPRAGVTLVAARPPLVAFNLRLRPPAGVQDAHRIAALIREGGPEGLPGLRAIGVALAGGVPQVSMNVERPFELSLAEVVNAVREHAAVESAELVGLAPSAAFEGFPEEVPLPGFDPARHLIENAIGCW